MYSLNYNLSYALSEYGKAIDNYSSFFTILIAMAVLGVVLIANLESGSNNLKITVVVATLSVFFTLYYFGLDLVNHFSSALNGNFMNNICFYYINALFSLIVIGAVFSVSNINYGAKFTLVLCYLAILGNLVFSLFISYSINADTFITLGNIAPMILVGNVISFIAYIVLGVCFAVETICKQFGKKEYMLYRGENK